MLTVRIFRRKDDLTAIPESRFIVREKFTTQSDKSRSL